MKKTIDPEQKETESRIQLHQEIIHLHELLRTYRSKNLLQITFRSIFIFSIISRLIKNNPFNFMDPLQSYCHTHAEQALIQGRDRILQSYASLQNFTFPASCGKYLSELMEHDGITILPWQLSALVPNDHRHFLFYFGRTLDRCLKTFSLDTEAVTQIFKQLYYLLTPNDQRISFKNEGMQFYSQARELAKNFLVYQSYTEQLFLDGIEHNADLLYLQARGLISVLLALMVESLASKIFWRFKNRQLFSPPLHYQNTAKLLTLKQQLKKDCEFEIMREQEIAPLKKVYRILQFVIFTALILCALSIPFSDLSFYLPGILLVGTALIYRFKLSNFGFQFCATDEKKTLQHRLTGLHTLFKTIPELTTILKVLPINLGYSSTSYILLTPRPNSTLTPGIVATILQQSLQSAGINFNAEGKEVIILSDCKISRSQQYQFKNSFQQLLKSGLSICQVKKQFFDIVKLLRVYPQINHTRIEEGFLFHTNPNSKLYIYSETPKVLQALTRLVDSLLIVEQECKQIIISAHQPLSTQALATLIKNCANSFNSQDSKRFEPLIFSPMPKQKKSRHDFPDAQAEPNTHWVPPAPLKIIWDRHHFYPHRDIQCVVGAVKRFIKFNLPPVCFDNDIDLMNHFKNKSTQMARREKNSQGIKHSTYTGHNFFTGKRESFAANVKLLGLYSNHRVLLKIHTANENGAILYEACAFERNVH